MTNALIFAGGSGTRMNSKSRPKQFLQFYGKELIIHTLENFQNHPEIDNIVVVCIADWIPYLEKLLLKYGIDKVKAVVSGGVTGQESIFKGLKAIKTFDKDEKSIVLIHDGVRPFINEDVILQLKLSSLLKTVRFLLLQIEANVVLLGHRSVFILMIFLMLIIKQSKMVI